ncbi:MAG: dehydratase [Rhodospirillaceae bacterium]|jgi:3-hydroxybutyryl-CoA dehydratase|nr:dehydratase [Rhodospirillaceae bacterium]MBT5899099.1 dehydratase [Rhodospirillaceae bacterium]MBT6429943.1 dehydratase [Rhodospirillaceae bacterium]
MSDLPISDLPVAIGDKATFTKTVGESDIYGFAGITGDFAAPHVNEAFMKNSQYGTRVAHGALLVGFMSTASALLATRIIDQRDDLTPMSIGYDRVRFTEAVKIGDTITVNYEIKDLEPERGRTRAALTATNQNGETVGVAEHIMKWLVNP